MRNSKPSEADVVKCWVMKRPSARAVKTKDRGRRVTPLSVKRIHTLRTAGGKTLRILDDAGSDEVMQNTEQVLLRLCVPAQRLCFIA